VLWIRIRIPTRIRIILSNLDGSASNKNPVSDPDQIKNPDQHQIDKLDPDTNQLADDKPK
jgi:hypothetical protein